MPDLYLIAHKVRGEPAFDIAERVECAECAGLDLANEGEGEGPSCAECDSLGYWWIIPTSGHRAYPWWHRLIEEINGEYWIQGDDYSAQCAHIVLPEMPLDLPDHYRAKAEPKRTIDVSALIKTKPFKMNRRI